jgi:hypothetical protein
MPFGEMRSNDGFTRCSQFTAPKKAFTKSEPKSVI